MLEKSCGCSFEQNKFRYLEDIRVDRRLESGVCVSRGKVKKQCEYSVV